MDEIETLRKIPLFGDMDDKEISGVREIMDAGTFAPGQTIIHEGDEGEHFYIILRGSVQYLTTDAGGQELVLDEAGPGDFFGELSMLTGGPRLIRVRAMSEEVRTLALDRKEFHEFLMKHPHAAIDVMTVLSRRLYSTDQLLRQSVSRNVNEVSEERQTFGQKVADKFAAMMGSWGFIIIQSAILAVWVAWNIVAHSHNQTLALKDEDPHAWFVWDAYPFIFLNLALSFQAAYAAPIIMMSQNRAGDKDRLSAEIDHQVNVKAEVKVGLIMNRLDDIERGMHYLHQQQCDLFRGEKGKP